MGWLELIKLINMKENELREVLQDNKFIDAITPGLAQKLFGHLIEKVGGSGYTENLTIIYEFLYEKIRVDKYDIGVVARQGGISFLKLFIQINGNDKNIFRDNISDGGFPLACSHGRIEVVKILLKYGANIESQFHHTGLALSGAYPEIVTYLISKGANTRWSNKYGETVLSCFLEEKKTKLESIHMIIDRDDYYPTEKEIELLKEKSNEDNRYIPVLKKVLLAI